MPLTPATPISRPSIAADDPLHSAAPLAHDLRVLVRERLKAGDSDPQVLDFLVARYGEFVLLKPRFEWQTALLWLTPLLLLAGAAIALARHTRRRLSPTGDASDATPLSPAEQQRLDALLSEKR